MSDIDNETIAALSDSFGIRAYALSAKYYTPMEKNTLSPAFGGMLLINRFVWMMVGSATLALSYFTFSFKEKNKKVKSENLIEPISPNTSAIIEESSMTKPLLYPLINPKTSKQATKISK